MSLEDTALAIGAVSKIIRENLEDASGIKVTVGRPEPGASTSGEGKLNLFLYEASFDPSLKNIQLIEGQPPPLWFVLKYLVTAYDESADSDSTSAHELLGKGASALQELSFISLNPTSSAALIPNPEVLKITFDQMNADLISKIMQGGNEKYRISLGFQVRPIMIATREKPAHSLLVGVDYTKTPPDNIIGEKGVKIDVLPSLGPTISSLIPDSIEPDTSIVILGNDLNLTGLTVHIGPATFPVDKQTQNKLSCKIDHINAGGNKISAGSHPISVIQKLNNGRNRSSNLLTSNLLPVINSVNTSGIVVTTTTSSPPQDIVKAKIQLFGFLLGTSFDDISLSFFKDGNVHYKFDNPTSPPGLDQTQLNLDIVNNDEVLAGTYRLILHVNGQQAKYSPEITLI
jgi:hypothetical protein